MNKIKARQFELFVEPFEKKSIVTSSNNSNEFHRIYEMKENGEMEWVDSYSSKFSVQYAMEIFYCNKRHLAFFDMNNINKAREAIKISKTMRSVILELDGHTYICSSKHGNTVIEGISCSKFDFKPFRPI